MVVGHWPVSFPCTQGVCLEIPKVLSRSFATIPFESYAVSARDRCQGDGLATQLITAFHELPVLSWRKYPLALVVYEDMICRSLGHTAQKFATPVTDSATIGEN